MSNTFTCDFCDETEHYGYRHVVPMVRPSDPTELVAIMWACRPCGFRDGLPSAEQLHREVEAGMHEGVAFVTV